MTPIRSWTMHWRQRQSHLRVVQVAQETRRSLTLTNNCLVIYPLYLANVTDANLQSASYYTSTSTTERPDRVQKFITLHPLSTEYQRKYVH